MSQSGRSCRGVSRGTAYEAEPFHVEARGDTVVIESHGRQVCVVAGRAADELRRALAAGDGAAVQQLAARKAGRRQPRSR